MPKQENEAGTETAGKVDRIIHEPARFATLAILNSVESADFLYLMNQIGLTWGNLSSHLTKLEVAGYITIEKGFLGKKPHTTLKITKQGQAAFAEYRRNMQSLLDSMTDKTA